MIFAFINGASYAFYVNFRESATSLHLECHNWRVKAESHAVEEPHHLHNLCECQEEVAAWESDRAYYRLCLSRCSIFPSVDDSVSAFDVVVIGFNYSDIFDGLEFTEIVMPYDELFRRSNGGEESSDEAGTSAGTESASVESNLCAGSKGNSYLLNKDFCQSPES